MNVSHGLRTILCWGAICGAVHAAEPAPAWQRVLQDADSLRAEQLKHTVNEWRLAGDYAGAIDPAEELFALYAEALGSDHWQAVGARRAWEAVRHIATLPSSVQAKLAEADRLQAEAEEHYNAGDYVQAAEMVRDALTTRRRHLGAMQIDVSDTVFSLANTYRERRDPAAAAPWFRQALRIRRHVLGNRHPETGIAALAVADNLHNLGHYARAESYYRDALATHLAALGPGHPQTGKCANNAASNLSKQDKSAEAEPLYRTTLEIFRRELGEEREETAIASINLANTLVKLGRHLEAERLARGALAVCRRKLGDDDFLTAVAYESLASNLNARGRHVDAEPLARQALRITHRAVGDDDPRLAESLDGLAHTLNLQGRHAEAVPLLRQALALDLRALGASHPTVDRRYNNLAFALNDLGDLEEARMLFEKVLESRRQSLGERSPHTAVSYNNLGYHFARRRNYARAEPPVRAAMKIWEATLGPEHPETAMGWFNLGYTLNQLGRYGEAESLLRTTLDAWRAHFGDEHYKTAMAYGALARNLDGQGRYLEAEEAFVAAEHGFESARAHVAPTGIDRADYTARRSPLREYAAMLARLDRPVDAWTKLEQHLARGLWDDLSRRASRDDDDVEADERGHSCRRSFDLDRVQASLPADAALLVWLDVEGTLDASAEDSDHWACVVRRHGSPRWVQLGGADGTWTAADGRLSADAYLALTDASADDDESWKALKDRLYRQRLSPVKPFLSAADNLPAVQHLIVIPSEAMAAIPVEVFADAYTVSYVPSGTVFAWLKEQREQRGPSGQAPRLLALGDPQFRTDERDDFLQLAQSRPREPNPDGLPVNGEHDYPKSPGSSGRPVRYASLPGTRVEVEVIARLFHENQKLLGALARKQTLQELAAADRLREFSHLHFATHGQPNDRAAMQSSLILASTSRDSTVDDRLTAEQILKTWNLDAELVTLSCCQSGLGRYADGEGHLGFSQALLLAGARSLVLSLWKVDDAATTLLMERFYANLLGRRDTSGGAMSKAAALHEAKAWLRMLSARDAAELIARLPADGDARVALTRGRIRTGQPFDVALQARPFEHPYYWSAFILIGDPD